MMLTSIFSSDFLVVVNSIFRKREPGDHHRGDNQATVIIIQWQEWKPCDFRSMFRLHSSTREHAVGCVFYVCTDYILRKWYPLLVK